MADRVLTWFVKNHSDLASLPRYYSDAEYEKVALRVYAETGPTTDDLGIDIQADGVSIFNNLPTYTFTTLGQRTEIPTKTPVLNKGEQESADDGDLNGLLIPQGVWITLTISDLNGAKGISIHLELAKLHEEESP